MTEDETLRGAGSANDFVPPDPTLERMQLAVQECRGCGLYARATQAVFGKGTQRAEIMLVGEQPGDKEDLAGEPFVGPSGKLLDTEVHAQWQAAAPRQAERLRDLRLQALVGARARRGEAVDPGLPGRHRGAGHPGRELPSESRPRTVLPIGAGTPGHGHGAPFRDPPLGRSTV